MYFGSRIVVVSHVVHYRSEGRLHAYAPYAREIEVWAEMFENVVIASPIRDEPPPGDSAALDRENISIEPQPESGGRSLGAKVVQALMVPRLAWGLARAMSKADVIHVRCPGNLGLLGALLAPLFPGRRIAKYAGQWVGYPGEAWSYRLQRAVLGSRWWGATVTVYGRWPDQPPHVVPFFTSVMTDPQVARARSFADEKRADAPPLVLYVGRLSASKNVDVLLTALARLREGGTALRAWVVGDGPEGERLRRQAGDLALTDLVEFRGAVSFDGVLRCYENADVLILVSETEGWPKAIAEAMVHGLACIGTDRGLMPEMLGSGRGLLVPPRDVEALVRALRRLADSPGERLEMGARAAEWAGAYSLEGLRDALAELLGRAPGALVSGAHHS